MFFPLRLVNYFLDRLFVVVGAFIGSQIPSFMHQYTQRLIGRVDELDFFMTNLRQLAAFSNKSLEGYIEKFLTNNDPDFIQQGVFMQDIVNRWTHLNQALQHLQTSLLWQRPFVFLQELQPDIAKSTVESFQPGFSLTIENACYAMIGLFLGLTLYQCLLKCLSIIYYAICSLFVKSKNIQSNI